MTNKIYRGAQGLTASLKQSEEIFKLGICADSSAFYWNYIEVEKSGYWRLEYGSNEHPKSIPAYSLEELHIIAYDCISGWCSNTFYATIDEYHSYAIDILDKLADAEVSTYYEGDTQAEAMADLTIILLRNKLVNAENANENLKRRKVI